MNHFLLVDDSENDCFLLQHALKKSGIAAVLHRANGVDEAMAYLRRGMADEIDLPCGVLCDVRLHNENGCELLAWMRQQPLLKNVAVLVWSGSRPPDASCTLEDLGIHSVINKPSDHDDFVSILQTLQQLCDRRAGANGG